MSRQAGAQRQRERAAAFDPVTVEFFDHGRLLAYWHTSVPIEASEQELHDHVNRYAQHGTYVPAAIWGRRRFVFPLGRSHLTEQGWLIHDAPDALTPLPDGFA